MFAPFGASAIWLFLHQPSSPVRRAELMRLVGNRLAEQKLFSVATKVFGNALESTARQAGKARPASSRCRGIIWPAAGDDSQQPGHRVPRALLRGLWRLLLAP